MEQTAQLAVTSQAPIGDEFLRGFWYPVLRSNQIRGRKLAASTRLEVPLVLGRDAGVRLQLHGLGAMPRASLSPSEMCARIEPFRSR